MRSNFDIGQAFQIDGQGIANFLLCYKRVLVLWKLPLIVFSASKSVVQL